MSFYILIALSSCNSSNIAIDKISISLTDNDFQALERMRSKVLFQKKTLKKDRKFVPCIMGYGESLIAGKVRLKGDRLGNYEDGKASYRIELEGDNFIMGMKKFSLHKPRTKNYVYESIFHKAIIREGIIGLRYKFIHLFINNSDEGIYALEEGMSKELIESSRRMDGPILHFSEDIDAANLDSMEVQSFGKVPKDAAKKAVYEKSKRLFTDFINKKLKVSDVFDVKRLGDFFALTDILEFHHGAVAKSVRYYFNPITFKFEPIGFDGHHGTEGGRYIAAELGINPKSGWFYNSYDEWFNLLFCDPQTFDSKFFSSYISSLQRMSKKSYLDSLLVDLNPQIQNELEIINTDSFPPLGDHIFSYGPDTFQFAAQHMYQRQEYCVKGKGILDNTKGIEAAIIANINGNLKIGIRTCERLPISLVSLVYDGKKIGLPSTIILPAKNWLIDTSYSILTISIPNFNLQKEFSIEYEIVGLKEKNNEIVKKKFYGQVRKLSLIIKDSSNELNQLSSYFKGFPFITFSPKLNEIQFNAGKWILDKPLTVPSGFKLTIMAGTEINIKNKSYIVSHSPVYFAGTENKQIKFFSSDSTGKGIFVTSDGELNKMNYVEFNNLAAPSSESWQLSGAVTFYESPVNISNCVFINLRSEDGLNIKRSDFNISYSLFQNTFSDAFDGDFVNGTVSNTKFINCGNDGIDGSGSIITIENVDFLNAKDKGISAGEESQINAINCVIQNSKIGFASKDLSHFKLTNCSIIDCDFGMVAYKKKNVFGPSIIESFNTSLINVKTEYLIEEKSSLSLENKPIGNYKKNVRNILYGF